MDAVFTNPAGLAGLQGDYLVLHHSTTLAGDANTLSLLVTPDLVGTIGLAYQLVDHGDIEMTDEAGNLVGVLSLRKHLLVASFATPLSSRLAAGLNYKLYQSRIGCRGLCSDQEIRAMTHAVDGGIRYQPTWPASLHLEAGVSNLGFPLQVINAAQADPMPGRIRVGATYQYLPQMPGDTTAVLAVSTQLVRGWRQGQSLNLSLAMELAAAESVFLRAGYNFGDGLEAGATIGLGLELNRFSLGIGKAFTPVIDPEREPFHVTLALRL